MFLSLNQSTIQNLDALTVIVREISTHELRSNSAFFLTLSISILFVVQTPDFGKMLLSLNKSTTQNLDAQAVVVCEISTPKLRSNLAFILTLSISEQGVVQTPDFGKILRSSSRSTTQNVDTFVVVVREILTHEFKTHDFQSHMGSRLNLEISKIYHTTVL